MIDRLNGYLKQPVEEKVSFAESGQQLAAIFAAEGQGIPGKGK